jgi:hypothetical protein
MGGKKGRRNMVEEAGLDYLDQHSDKRQEIAERLIKFWVPANAGNFSTG